MSADWKPVPGWEHLYEINREGAVRTKQRYKVVRSPYGRNRTVLIDPKPLATYKDGTGRERVQLRDGACSTTSRYVHDLLQQAWGDDEQAVRVELVGTEQLRDVSASPLSNQGSKGVSREAESGDDRRPEFPPCH